MKQVNKINLQKYVQLYVEVSTPMKQRKLLVDRVRVEHRLFRSSRKRQSLETGSYTVTASLGNARFQWLLCYIRAAAGFLETLYQDVIRSAGEKRGPTYNINK